MAKKAEIEQTEIEAPYELPEGWKWCRLGNFFTHTTGKALKKGNTVGSLKKYITTSNVYWNYFDFSDVREMYFADNELEKCTATKGDLLICNGGDVGRGAIWNFDYDICLQNHVSRLRKKTNNVSTEYFYYIFKFYKDSGLINGKGIGISSLSAKAINELIVPLPPTLAEQQRIVNRIESMFAKLDQAQEKAQAVLDSFETRKAAILHQAFTGNLTAKWRKENGISDDSWEEKTVGDCCSEVKVGIVIKPTRYYTESENGVPAFRSANVRENHIDNFDWVYINDEGMKNEQRSIVHTNDVLVVRSGAPGTACVVTEQFDGYNAIDILIAVPLTEVINSYFLCYYTNSPMGKNIVAEKKRGLGLTHFNVKGYSATPIKVPSLSEQQEIVRILDTVLEKESTAKSAAEQVLEQIDLLKKSILARAFRGAL